MLDADFAPAVGQQQHGLEGQVARGAGRGAGGDRGRAGRASTRPTNASARVEQIKKFTIVRGDWLPGGDELTPTMKLKRKPIAAKYAREIEAMYA